MWSLLSQGRGVQEVMSIFSDKTWDETPWQKKNNCARGEPTTGTHLGSRALEGVWEPICVSQAGCGTGCASVRHTLPGASFPRLPSQPAVTSCIEIWTALAGQLLKSILWSGLKICNREIIFLLEISSGYVSVCCCCRRAASSEVYALFLSAESGKEGLRCRVESEFVDCTLERIWMRTRTMISKTWCDRVGWKSRGSLARDSLWKRGTCNIQIYRGLLQEA